MTSHAWVVLLNNGAWFIAGSVVTLLLERVTGPAQAFARRAPFDTFIGIVTVLIALVAVLFSWAGRAQATQTASDEAQTAASAKHTAVIATAAAAQAKATSVCLNRVLADRNGLTAKDTAAHARYVVAAEKYDDALLSVLLAPPGSPTQKTAYASFVTIAKARKAIDSEVASTLVADQAARDAHPLGRC